MLHSVYLFSEAEVQSRFLTPQRFSKLGPEQPHLTLKLAVFPAGDWTSNCCQLKFLFQKKFPPFRALIKTVSSRLILLQKLLEQNIS